MKILLFFSGLVGGVVGFWVGITTMLFFGVLEKFYLMYFSLVMSGVFSYASVFFSKKILTHRKKSVLLIMLIIFIGILSLFFTFKAVGL